MVIKRNLRVTVVALVSALLFYTTSFAEFTCLDEDGNPVDRWSAIKGSNTGAYWYFDEDSNNWVKSKHSVLQSSSGMIMLTMNQMYGSSFNESEAIYGMFNDEPPPSSTASSVYAHAKGVLLSDSKKGFWLTHSMPKWPVASDDGPAPFPDDTYAQHLGCVTVSGQTANTIAKNLMISRPFIYDKHVGESVEGMYPDFESWVGGTYNKIDETGTNDFKSWNGAQYTQFVKSKNWGEDFWDDLVAPFYKSPLNVETWRSGSGGRMSSICGDGEKDEVYNVYEVTGVHMPDGTSWTGTQDHSKWASSADDSNKFYCLGDINRMCSQESRGGGGVCRKDSDIWKAFDSMATGYEPCWEYDPCGGSSQCYWCSKPGLE